LVVLAVGQDFLRRHLLKVGVLRMAAVAAVPVEVEELLQMELPGARG
jgi:hypothetical protein